MKNMKVCALLCAVALSANTALPVMAAENAENTQLTEAMTEVEETQPVEEQKDVVTENEAESDSAEQQEEVTESAVEPGQQESEPEGVQDETKQEETQVVPSEDNAKADVQGQAEVKEDGWYTDEDGNSYYYENGEMITGAIVEIGDEAGTYGYYFDDNGIVYKSGQTQISYWDDEKKVYIYGYIKADDKGHLYKGWDGNTYYGEDYFRYADKILEQDGASYYFNEYGYLVVNQAVVIDGVLYQADEKGVLTVKDTASKTGWEQAGEKWYYYKDGKALSNTFEVINGVQYHFGFNGTMDTGKFFVENSVYWAEPDGQVVKAKGWYHSTQTKKWYWFDEQGGLVCNALVNINGKNYYFAWDGEMQTGVFEAGYNDENGNWVNKKLYADAEGVISTSAGWKIENGIWYYVKEDGTGASDEIVEIGGKKYSFDWEGKMRTGKIEYWEDGKYKYIFTDSSGAIVTNNWVQDHLEWYYTDENGYILKNQWINDTFYVKESGAMAIGATQIDGKTYIFDENGYLAGILENMRGGWQLEDGDWYYIEDGEVVKGWKVISETKYYFDEDGKMVTDGLVPAEHLADRYSYVDQNGHVKSGWAQGWNDWDWLYFERDEETGDIVDFENGWKQINGTYYYFDEDGYMVANDILEIDGKLSKFDASGAWVDYATSGWQQIGSEWYYVNADGTLNTERTKTINEVTYYFSPYGLMSHNTSYYDEKTKSYYWINGNGNLDTSNGWKKTPWNEWFYVENGKLVSGTTKVINGVEYTFYIGGRMITSELQYDGVKYFLYDENGKKIDVSKDGWYSSKREGRTVWYYFKNGRPYDGKLGNYYMSYGQMITGVYGSSSALYLFDENGILQKNGWKLYQGAWYYAGSSGRLYTGERKINGKTYWFDKHSGEWIR